jgi:formate-dependent nitrite reductase cytochrome c552 subunit
MKKPIIFIILAAALLLGGITYAQHIEDVINAVAKAEYVGSERCAGCHDKIYNSWLTTLHPYKIRPVNENTVVGDFVKNNAFTVKNIKGMPFTEYTTKMSVKDGKYYITTIGEDGKEHTYLLKYVLGGVWKQRYITEFPNGGLHVLPLQWNVDTRTWADYHGLAKQKPGDKGYWSNPARPWQLKCGSCHTTGLKINYDAKANKFNTTWADTGAACEACHGPGSEHVIAPMDKKIATIVNPAKIPDARRAAQVCGQCHNRGKSIAKAISVPGGPDVYDYPNGAAGYIPGKTLYNYYIEKPGEWPDGSPKQHHQQYNDWKKSQHAAHGVNCWDCHASHGKGAISKHSLKEGGDKLCMSCHQVQNELMHSIHSSNTCIGCHMPRTAKNAVKTGEAAYDIADHRFKVVSPAETIKYGGLAKQPNSCNGCHYHEKKDTPESLLKAMETIRNKKRESLGMEKQTIPVTVEKKAENKK